MSGDGGNSDLDGAEFADTMASAVELGGLMNLKRAHGRDFLIETINDLSLEDSRRLLLAAVTTLTDPRLDAVWLVYGAYPDGDDG